MGDGGLCGVGAGVITTIMGNSVRPIKISRDESFLSTLIRCVRRDEHVKKEICSAGATGFYWELDDQWYLITNHHNLSGWNSNSGQSLSKSAMVPTHVEITIALRGEGDSPPKQSGLKFERRRLSLIENEEPCWLEHPTYGAKVDVAVLPVFDSPTSESLAELGATGMFTRPVNTFDDWVRFEPAAGDDVYILGFPFAEKMGQFPIWKRGSIATEPDFEIDGLPKILIDTATRPGMSGSPVIVARKGFTAPSGKLDDDTVIGDAHSFLGVYSGRIGSDLEGLQLGVVWKGHVINEIIRGGRRAKWPWTSDLEY